MAGSSHPALFVIPADHFLLTALLLNTILLVQWSRVQRRLRQQPIRAQGPISATEVPNASWLEPFSPEHAVRRLRALQIAHGSYRSARRVRAAQRKARPTAQAEYQRPNVVVPPPVVLRERVLL